MENKTIDSSLKDALMGLQNYVDLQIKYNKLLLAKRMAAISSVFAFFMILLIIFSFALFFLSFWFVEWFSAHIGNRYYGNLIVFGFYMLIGIMLILFREQIIFGPIRRMFTRNFASDDLNEDNNFRYHSKDAINLQLKNYRDILKEEGEELKVIFDNLGQIFTLPNILSSVGKSIYKSFVTTSNVAMAAFNLIGRFRSKPKKKTKKDKKEPPLLEEEGEA